jgi:NAD(P)-dependent dehydrogenase (short-subunit alcohol dehydrogenase family)
VLITGASSGLGEALAHTFYRAGCQVVLAARREVELQRVREDLIRGHEVNLSCSIIKCAQKLGKNFDPPTVKPQKKSGLILFSSKCAAV